MTEKKKKSLVVLWRGKVDSKGAVQTNYSKWKHDENESESCKKEMCFSYSCDIGTGRDCRPRKEGKGTTSKSSWYVGIQNHRPRIRRVL